jgi:RimJ/RimL family protein N-acetyltransferase
MNVLLREFSPNDIPMLDSWVAHGDLMQFTSRWTPRSFSEGHWLSELACWHVIVAEEREVGTIWLERAHTCDVVADLGIFLGRADDRGRGIGRRAIELAEKNVLTRWNLERIRLHVREENQRAISCYHSARFEISGHGQKTIGGQMIDFLEMTHRLKRANQESSGE